MRILRARTTVPILRTKNHCQSLPLFTSSLSLCLLVKLHLVHQKKRGSKFSKYNGPTIRSKPSQFQLGHYFPSIFLQRWHFELTRRICSIIEQQRSWSIHICEFNPVSRTGGSQRQLRVTPGSHTTSSLLDQLCQRDKFES